MDVSLTEDVRFKKLSAKLEKVTLKSFTNDSEVTAYKIEARKSYTLHFKPTIEPCPNDTWTFELFRSSAPCNSIGQKHHQTMGRPKMSLSNRGIELHAYGMGQELLVGGMPDALTFHLGVEKTTGCDVCDLFFVRVGYYSCNERSEPISVYVPVVLFHGED
jgi:hypothetical protein